MLKVRTESQRRNKNKGLNVKTLERWIAVRARSRPELPRLGRRCALRFVRRQRGSNAAPPRYVKPRRVFRGSAPSAKCVNVKNVKWEPQPRLLYVNPQTPRSTPRPSAAAAAAAVRHLPCARRALIAIPSGRRQKPRGLRRDIGTFIRLH